MNAIKTWREALVIKSEHEKYLCNGADFINDSLIEDLLAKNKTPDKNYIVDILSKSLSLKRLEPQETAALLNVSDNDLWQEIFATARKLRDKVYGPRIVTFAPLYCSNLCVNSCQYCAFRSENRSERRRKLSVDEVRKETEALISIGHKRLIVVYGEHPETDIDYMDETIRAIYDTKLGNGEIRRVNINAAPQNIANYKRLRDIGIGTYQVFQETYHHETYKRVHPAGLKSDYQWRLYALHRAQEAGVDDVAIGVLFGLYDWRFEVMGLLFHAIDLEDKFGGIGPHTISFPRLEPASDTPLSVKSPYMVSDENFKKVIAVLRLSVPYTGMIITARETPEIRKEAINLGCTQTDASTKIGVGAYSEKYDQQEPDRQQFLIGDTRNLDTVIRELAGMGYLTSFCTAGYRCGRTGVSFMDLAKSGKVNQFCMPNAILTFKEYLQDYATEETKRIGEKLISAQLQRIAENLRPVVECRIKETENGARDIRF